MARIRFRGVHTLAGARPLRVTIGKSSGGHHNGNAKHYRPSKPIDMCWPFRAQRVTFCYGTTHSTSATASHGSAFHPDVSVLDLDGSDSHWPAAAAARVGCPPPA
jgi:hypothetical protein